MRYLFIQKALIATLIGVVVGCGGDNDSAHVRVFHASPDAPNVDVLIDGGRVLQGVPYSAASDFLEVAAGHLQLTVTPEGSNTGVIDTRIDLDEGGSYLVIAAGKVSSIFPILEDVDSSAIPANSSRVRVLHTAPSAPNVDVYVVASGAGIQDAAPVLENVPFKAVSQYLTVPTGTYDLFVTVSGTKTVAIQALGVVLADGFRGSIAALDAKGGGAPFSLKILDESQR